MDPQIYISIALPVLYEIITLCHNNDICSFRVTCKKIRDEIDTKLQPLVVTRILYDSEKSYGVIDSETNIFYVTCGFEHVVKEIDLNTNTVRIIGGKLEEKGFEDGRAEDSRFNYPSNIVLDKKNKSLYVNDSRNRVIRRIDLIHNRVTTLKIFDPRKLPLRIETNAVFSHIEGIALDPIIKCLYICADRSKIQRLMLTEKTLETLCGGNYGTKNGTFEEAMFKQPRSIVMNPSTNELYIFSNVEKAVRVISLSNRTVYNLYKSLNEYDQSALSEMNTLTINERFDYLYIATTHVLISIPLFRRDKFKYDYAWWNDIDYFRPQQLVLDDSRCSAYIISEKTISTTKIVDRKKFKKIRQEIKEKQQNNYFYLTAMKCNLL